MKLAVYFIISLSFLVSCQYSKNEKALLIEKIKAEDVKDKESLKSFVLSAKEHLEKDYEQAVKDFRTQKEWKTDFIYVHGLSLDGTTLFHVALPELEGQNLLSDSEIGNSIIKTLLLAGKTGGGFTEYIQDNPLKEGVDQSKKIAYVATFKKDGKDYLVSSGFYLD